MNKSPDAFRTISEVAEHLETPAHVLRFWESRFPQIRPVKRAGGRRYYRPADVSLLTGIKRLLHDEGMTIRGVQKILREQGVRHVAGLSGDVMDEDAEPFAAYVDPPEADAEDVIVPIRAEPADFRAAPGLAAAMAKAVDHELHSTGSAKAPVSSLPMPEPTQGALLLTPAPMAVQGAVPEPQDVPEPENVPIDDSVAEAVRAAAQQDIGLDAGSDAPSLAGAQLPDSHLPDGSSPDSREDFADDDSDDQPMTTLATRIRMLPPEASATHVGAELRSVVARLQALRDRMADAAHPGRS